VFTAEDHGTGTTSKPKEGRKRRADLSIDVAHLQQNIERKGEEEEEGEVEK